MVKGSTKETVALDVEQRHHYEGSIIGSEIVRIFHARSKKARQLIWVHSMLEDVTGLTSAWL